MIVINYWSTISYDKIVILQAGAYLNTQYASIMPNAFWQPYMHYAENYASIIGRSLTIYL